MKTKIVLFMIVEIVALLIGSNALFAWNGETPFGQISREEILRRASEMINLSWSPLKNISNQCSLDNPRWNYNAGTVYHGVAYNRYNDPVDNWADFYPKVNSVNCQGTRCLTSYGNECSSFVSIAWRLPERYNTTAFECDAANSSSTCGNYNPASDDYVTKLGETGSGQIVAKSLLPGDAFVNAGSHILLFEKLHEKTSTGEIDGIWALEQTPKLAVRDQFWSWTRLADYRPIRRNKIDEGNYTFMTKWGAPGTSNGLFNEPTAVATDSSGNVYVTDQFNNSVQKFTSNGGFITKWGSYGTGNGQFIGPLGIAVASSGNVYVADSGNSRIQKFNSSGGFLTTWGSVTENGCEQNKFAGPGDIAVDSSNNVYAADTEDCYLQKFTSNGGFLSQWYFAPPADYSPYNIAIDQLSGYFS